MKRVIVILLAGKAKDVFEQIAHLARDQGNKTIREVLNDQR